MKRWKIAAVSASVLATASAGAVAAQAQASLAPRAGTHPVPNIIAGAPPCAAASCVGQSPYVTNYQGYSCVDAPSPYGSPTSIATVTSGSDGGVAYLRYSPYCDAKWASVPFKVNSSIGFYATSPDGTEEWGGSAQYSAMINGAEKDRACLEVEGEGIVSYTCTKPT